MSPTPPDARQPAADAIFHWYDFVCPFCYLSQPDNAELVAAGLPLVELGFSAHPEIPPGGSYVGPRSGAMYDSIGETASRLRLPLNWPDRLPNSRLALSAAEWVRAETPEAADGFRQSVFAAHFAEGRDIGDIEVVLTIAGVCGVRGDQLAEALRDQRAAALLDRSQALGRGHRVSGTPAWFAHGRLVVGLQPPGALVRRLQGGGG